MCGADWGVWSRLGCVEQIVVCGADWGVWIRLGCVEQIGVVIIENGIVNFSMK